MATVAIVVGGILVEVNVLLRAGVWGQDGEVSVFSLADRVNMFIPLTWHWTCSSNDGDRQFVSVELT